MNDMYHRIGQSLRFESLENRVLLTAVPVELDLQIAGEETVGIASDNRSAVIDGNNLFFGRPGLATRAVREDLLRLDEQGEWSTLRPFDGESIRWRAHTTFDGQLLFATSGGNLFSTDGTHVRLIQRRAGAVDDVTHVRDELYVSGGRSDPIWRLQVRNRQIKSTQLQFTGARGWVEGVTAMDDHIMFFQRGQNGSSRSFQLYRSFANTDQLTRVINRDFASVKVLGAVDGRFLFISLREETASEYELWSSDGTVDGTIQLGVQLSDLHPQRFAAIEGGFVFGANDGKIGNELWKTDGSVEGTQLVRDIQNDLDISSDPGVDLVASVNGRGLLQADDGLNGIEFWTTDGTEAGTQLLVDSAPGADDCRCTIPRQQPIDDRLVFYRGGELENNRLPNWWLTDGTTDGTWSVAQFMPDGLAEVRPPEVFSEGYLYFTARFTDGNWQLWKSNGTAEGTALAAQVDGQPGGLSTVGVAGERVVFRYFNSERGQSEVWSTTGEPDSTLFIGDIRTSFAQLKNLDAPGKLFFSEAVSGSSRSTLWQTDGTPEGTKQITRSLDGELAAPVVLGQTDDGLHIFDRNSGGSKLWNWTPGASAVAAVPRTPRSISGSSSPFDSVANNELYEADGKHFFTENVRDREGRSRLWQHEGSSFRGIAELPEIRSVVPVNNKLLLSTNDRLIRIYDPETNQITRNEVRATRPVSSRAVIHNTAYFVAASLFNRGGQQLWRSDGTVEGTMAVSQSGAAHIIGTLGNQLLFAGRATEDGQGLWTSDGTTAGTRRIHDSVLPVQGSRSVEAGGYLYFNGSDADNGSEVWRTDGTPEGTELYLELNIVGDSNPTLLGATDRDIVFLAGEPNKKTLWKATIEDLDTPAVTQLLQQQMIEPQSVEVVNGKIYFTTAEALFEWPQLFVTDGDIAKQIELPNTPNRTAIESLKVAGDRLYFSAANSLWYIDTNTNALVGDVNGDNHVNSLDIDSIRAGVGSSDVNNDGQTNELDVQAVLAALGTLSGDANLDRAVDFTDFLELSKNFGKVGGWAEGDFDGSGEIDFADFLLLSGQFGFGHQAPAANHSTDQDSIWADYYPSEPLDDEETDGENTPELQGKQNA